MSASSRLPAIVTAMNLNGLGVARALGRHGVPVIGIHGEAAGFELRTRYLTERWLRGPTPEDLLALLYQKGPTFADRPVLLPITDESVELIAQNLDDLRRFYRIAMPAPDVVLALLDKDRMRDIAVRHDVAVPPTWLVADTAELERVAGAIVYPCILKPATKDPAWQAADLRKAYVLEDRAALVATWREVARVSPRVIVQQFVPGGDELVYFTLLYCRKGGEAVAAFSGRKLRQWRPHCGGTAACEPVQVPQIEDTARTFFRALEMHGLCSLEYKRDPRDGSYAMIEPTVCRPDWQNGVADSNGVPLAYLAYCDLAGEALPALRRGRGKRRWVYLSWDRRAAAYYRARGELSRLAWLWSIRPPVRGAVLALDDLGPWLATVAEAWRRARRKVARRLGRGGAAGKTT